ncbi:CG15398 [Drosophila busckii]|uniref:CG15398 n=1 Tax=Drosophila busckii TaxID=30019 RepID=A0A0M5IVW1_DROBS|nr:CG15398 [Drosophila busckii]
MSAKKPKRKEQDEASEYPDVLLGICQEKFSVLEAELASLMELEGNCTQDDNLSELLGQDEVVTDYDILTIYKNVSKLSAIESYLKISYRPFQCFVNCRTELKLLEVETFLPKTDYTPDRHPALFVRLSNPVCSLRVYENGNIYCQGYSCNGAASGIQSFIASLEILGYEPVFHNPVFNVVNATFCLPFRVDLEQLYLENRDACVYNPETHPYLMYKVPDLTIKLAIFSTGCVFVLLSLQPICTQKAIAYIMPVIYRHKATRAGSGVREEAEVCSGDINFNLLWENEFQKAYQGSVKY